MACSSYHLRSDCAQPITRMFEHVVKPPRPNGRLKQLNKAARRLRKHGKRSEFIIHCEREEALRLARGW